MTILERVALFLRCREYMCERCGRPASAHTHPDVVIANAVETGARALADKIDRRLVEDMMDRWRAMNGGPSAAHDGTH